MFVFFSHDAHECYLCSTSTMSAAPNASRKKARSLTLWIIHESLFIVPQQRDGVRNRTAEKKVWFWLTAEENWISPLPFMCNRTSLPKVADNKVTMRGGERTERMLKRFCGRLRCMKILWCVHCNLYINNNKKLQSNYFNASIIKSVGEDENTKYSMWREKKTMVYSI